MFFKPNSGAEFEIWAVSCMIARLNCFFICLFVQHYNIQQIFQWDYHDWDSEHWPMPYATCEGQIWFASFSNIYVWPNWFENGHFFAFALFPGTRGTTWAPAIALPTRLKRFPFFIKQFVLQSLSLEYFCSFFLTICSSRASPGADTGTVLEISCVRDARPHNLKTPFFS